MRMVPGRRRVLWRSCANPASRPGSYQIASTTSFCKPVVCQANYTTYIKQIHLPILATSTEQLTRQAVFMVGVFTIILLLAPQPNLQSTLASGLNSGEETITKLIQPVLTHSLLAAGDVAELRIRFVAKWINYPIPLFF